MKWEPICFYRIPVKSSNKYITQIWNIFNKILNLINESKKLTYEKILTVIDTMPILGPISSTPIQSLK